MILVGDGNADGDGADDERSSTDENDGSSSSSSNNGDADECQAAPSCNFCTFAVTGAVSTFQPIFVCHECFNENTGDQETPLCICQACADICHDSNDHDVEYIGMGPCYCDCDHVGNCSIFQKSIIEAERLGVMTQSKPPAPEQKNDRKTFPSSREIPPITHVFDDYRISKLQDTMTASYFIEQAHELIKHTKETHWVDKNKFDTHLCAFERLAWSIYQSHQEHYDTLLSTAGTMSYGGAEWWVQVKQAKGDGKECAIDLHYDKDEALAESFGIGSFPVLSTVTYLTTSQHDSPTIIFDHTYTQGEDDLIHSMVASRPVVGKHLVFDGTLLHGAPSHSSLKTLAEVIDKRTHGNVDMNMGNEADSPFRITFLVNLWRDRKPANVHPLDDTIRQKLFNVTSHPPPLEFPFFMEKHTIPHVTLTKEDDLPESLRHRIELPFLSKGATWEDQMHVSGDDDDDEDFGMVVVTFPPPPSYDTLLVKFDEGLQAYLDYPQKQQQDLDKKKAVVEHHTGYC